MNQSIVDRLHGEYLELVQILDKAAEPSLRNTAEESFRKALLLTAASYFEVKITEAILDFVCSISSGDSLIREFVDRKALQRQYHTLFDWDGPNANRFFRFFGDAFFEFMKTRIAEDTELSESITAFMEIGSDRNRLVHQDFGAFSMEKTAEEIYSLYKKGWKFVSSIGSCLTTCAANTKTQAQG